LRACLDTGRALDALLRVHDSDHSLQVAKNVVRADIDALTTILAKVP